MVQAERGRVGRVSGEVSDGLAGTACPSLLRCRDDDHEVLHASETAALRLLEPILVWTQMAKRVMDMTLVEEADPLTHGGSASENWPYTDAPPIALTVSGMTRYQAPHFIPQVRKPST